jgi:dienelactone hydrolase
MRANDHLRELYQHDPFAQFLAANGYIVLRTDQRVPPRENAGVALGQSLDGILFDWERVGGLLAAGATWLAESGLVDPQRICVVGHGTGGAYLAYVTALEHPRQFACAAAVSSSALGARVVGGGGGAYFSPGPPGTGNPLRRAEDLEVPIFIAHVTNETIANSFEQRNPMVGFSFAALVEALRREEKSYVSVERDGSAGPGQSERYRVDALTRVVEFIDEQLDSSSMKAR